MTQPTLYEQKLDAARAWRASNGARNHPERVALLTALMDAVDALPCCDMHNRNCEPPSELCCEDCTEAAHGLLGVHMDGSHCIAPDLSGFGSETS